ncbi:MAG: hypothetical protein J5537_05250 [Lachnospiraceae bacterium]|nr:hypothetical protein [Lachnospiraceae bacterium]
MSEYNSPTNEYGTKASDYFGNYDEYAAEKALIDEYTHPAPSAPTESKSKKRLKQMFLALFGLK